MGRRDRKDMAYFPSRWFRAAVVFAAVISLVLIDGQAWAQTSRLPSLAETKKKAEAGDAQAQFDLGRRLSSSGAYRSAANWYLKAALQDHLEAQTEIGAMLVQGRGGLVFGQYSVAKNEQEGVVWLAKAANRGSPGAMHLLARSYLNGAGVKVDRVEAYKWLKLAVDRSQFMDKGELDQLILEMSSEDIAQGQRRADQFRIQDPKPRTSAESSGLISDHLVLKGIMGSSSKRLALINSRTFEAGETALVKTTAGDVEVRCLEIGEGFVRIKVGTNAEQVLRLPAH
jgi:hypothetical protein